MLGIDRRAVRYAWTAATVILLLCLIYLVRRTLLVFILSLLFAYLLSPLVNLLDRILPTNRTRTIALALAYIIFIGAVVVVGIQIGSRVVAEATALAKQLPSIIATQETLGPGTPPAVNSLKSQLLARARTEIARRSGDLVTLLAQTGLRFITVAGDLIYVVIIPIVAFFFLKDASLFRQHILDLVDEGPRRELLNEVMTDIDLLLAHYMRALVLLSLATFTAYSIFFAITGVRYGILLAALASALEFIPMLGPFTAGVTILVVAGVGGARVLTVLIFLLAYRLFQDYILSPHVMGQGVELHPALVLFGVFAGAEVAGIAGAFLSVPVLALIRILYIRIRKTRLSARLAPAPVVTR
jgi:predicted PurR-regulated permease PerM